MLQEPCSLDRIAEFSPWPARLLGLTPWPARAKNPAEITREFEGEKWGPLWGRVRAADHPVTFTEFLTWTEDAGREEFCSQGEQYFILKPDDIRGIYLDLVTEALQPWLPAPLVELGCGYGGVLLPLAHRCAGRVGQLVAGDFTRSGVELVQHFAAQEKLPLQAGACDLGSPGLTSMAIPRDAIIYTNYAAHYVPSYTPRLIEDIAAFQPRVVVHFEPLYEHTSTDSLIGQMRRRYIELNDYNRNLLTVLREAAAAGRIEILRESPSVFGRNALLPASIVAWKPL